MELPMFMLFEVFDLGAVREPMGVISFGVRLYGVRGMSQPLANMGVSDQDFMVLVECALRCGGTAGGRFSNVVGGGGKGVIGDLMSSFSEESSPGEGGKAMPLGVSCVDSDDTVIPSTESSESSSSSLLFLPGSLATLPLSTALCTALISMPRAFLSPLQLPTRVLISPTDTIAVVRCPQQGRLE
uniref:Uncharacterized protein n=1 Tax=Glossina austeni TaxID=7395 RepID=A0A1A9UXN1_GLOAU